MRARLLIMLILMTTVPVLTAMSSDASDSSVSPRLQVMMASTSTGAQSLPVWVYFKDKGLSAAHLADALVAAELNLKKRTAKRRAKTQQIGESTVDFRDLMVAPKYIAKVTALGAEPREQSRWFNAASFNATSDQVTAIAKLPFVKKVTAVAQGYRRRDLDDQVSADDTPVSTKVVSGEKYLFDYGPSLTQNALANIPAAHDAGWSGAGVIIGVLDSGFRTTHPAFSHLDVIATYDFVNDDAIVNDEPGDPEGSDIHGSKVLSEFAAFSEGNLIGSAFNVSVILAKTEDIGDEQPIEEDYWVAGLEWVESLGADIVSSSLGYYYWYTYEDLDGNTALTTRAADMAVSRGMLVVTSAGNERDSEWGWVTAPADGDSVIAVGATYTDGIVAYFSSPGPTYDGRIKPDVVAMGRSNIMISTLNENDTGFSNWSGTSFACPITAGVAALVLEKHPSLTPMQVRDALRETADRAENPDFDYGWGMINAAAALDYFVPKFTHVALPDTEDETGPYVVTSTLTYPMPLIPGTANLVVRFNSGPWQSLPLTQVAGSQWSAAIAGQPHGTLVEYYLTAENNLNEIGLLPLAAPVEFFAFDVALDTDPPTIAHDSLPDWPNVQWPPYLTAHISDNAFVTTATVEWSLAGVPQTPFDLVSLGDNEYAAAFPLTGDFPAIGDSIAYTISAADGSAPANIALSGPYSAVTTAAPARVLLIDDTDGSVGPADMALWLTSLGYDHQTIAAGDLHTATCGHWQALIIAGGSNETPGLSDDPVLHDILREWVDTGISIFLEGGNWGPLMFFYDAPFAEDVFHMQTWLPSNGGYFVRNSEFAAHPVLSNPNVLGNSMVLAYSPQGQDTILPGSGAISLFSPYSYSGAGGVIAFDNTPAPDGGQFVQLTADMTSFLASANVDQLFENAMSWLTAVEPDPNASLSGRVNLLGSGDGGAMVTAGHFYQTTTTDDGYYSFPGMYAGSHELRVSKPGFETQLVTVELTTGENLTDMDFALAPVEEFSAFNDTVLVIPGSDALGIDSFITFGPEYTGKTLADIRVTVDISHNNSGDLIIKLFSPAGTEVRLRYNRGGTIPDIVGTFPNSLPVDGPGSLDDFIGEPLVGTWRLNISDTVITVNGQLNFWSLALASALDISGVQDEISPLQTTLLHNVPNPFNPTTRIAFDLAHNDHTRVAVYDLKGRLVRTLIEARLQAGRHNVIWDGKDTHGRTVASGVYFYRLETTDLTQQAKMILVK